MPDQYTFYRDQERESSCVLRSESLMQVSTAEECPSASEEAFYLSLKKRPQFHYSFCGPPDSLNPEAMRHSRNRYQRDVQHRFMEDLRKIQAERKD